MNGSCAGDTQVLDVLAVQPHHAFATVFLKGTQPVNAFVEIGLQHGTRIQMQVDVGFQFYGTGHECLAARQIHLPTPLFRACINGLLDGPCVIRDAVTFGSKIHHVKNPRLREKSQRDQQQNCRQAYFPNHILIYIFRLYNG